MKKLILKTKSRNYLQLDLINSKIKNYSQLYLKFKQILSKGNFVINFMPVFMF